MSDIVGIDFGTSTCKMVRYEQGELERVRFGGATTTMPELLPSYISFHEDEVRDAGEMGTIIVGGTAKAEALLRFEATYPSSSPGHEPIKINITSSDEDFTPYRPTHTELFDRTLYRAPDMAVEIFSYMMNMGAEYLGYQPGSAVLTVPAYFSNEQFAAIREAAQEAGLHVEDRVPEPVAAAVSYAWRRGLQGNVLVYDFGGGTFDTTVIGVSDSQYEVYAKLGNPELGGTDLDRILYNTLFRSWGEDVTGWASLSQDPDAPDRDDAEVNTARQQLADAAEQAKIELSSAEEVSKNITLLAASGEQITRTLTLTRSDLEAQIGHLIRGTFDTVQRVIQKAGMRNEDIDHVLPVGGVTRMPLIRDSLARDFGPDKICIPNSPDTAVAEGAALVAARDEIGLNPTVKDVLGLSLRMQKPESIETSVVIPSGTSIEDCEKTIRFRWGSASKYEVNLCEGENLEYHENEPIGYLLLEPGQELARVPARRDQGQRTKDK
ncbi:MAG: Hsp70 family protein [Armatimonadota bacterium]